MPVRSPHLGRANVLLSNDANDAADAKFAAVIDAGLDSRNAALPLMAVAAADAFNGDRNFT